MCIILDYVFKSLDNGTLSTESPTYPIVALEKYNHPSKVVGVGCGEGMQTEYGIVLRAEFVKANLASTHCETVISKFCQRARQMWLGYYWDSRPWMRPHMD